ncbi:MAG: tRNA (guanosine(46)-N7)-methyltransferase TrmB [Steroidobacteraceae bacterium]
MEGPRSTHRQLGSQPAVAGEHPRAVRSFVTRAGRITTAQERALLSLWPSYGIEPAGMLDLDALFGRSAPRSVEIGFGNGENLLALAALHPERDYLGIEVHRPGVGRLLLALAALDLKNVRVICRDTVEVLEQHLPPACLDEVLVLFPDPWPKKRHHKRRLIQGPFVSALTAHLRRGATLHLATDWGPYAEQMLAVLTAEPRLRNLAPQGGFVPRPPGRPQTRFERRAERLGHRVWDLAFTRI